MPTTWFQSPMDLEDLPRGVRYPHIAVPEAVVSRYVDRYSRPGETVLDPFAGYGSTLTAATNLGRKACGVEIDPERVAYLRRTLPEEAQLICGDARDLLSLDLPEADLCVTGPPFFASERLMNMEIPTLGESYDEYLAELTRVFDGVAKRVRPGGYVITLFCNLAVPADFWNPGSPASLLPLAWDAGRAISAAIPLVAEEIWCISRGAGRSPFAGRHGQFLLFRRPSTEPRTEDE